MKRKNKSWNTRPSQLPRITSPKTKVPFGKNLFYSVKRTFVAKSMCKKNLSIRLERYEMF